MRYWVYGIGLFLVGCWHLEEPPLEKAQGYPKPIADLLSRRCAGCHNGGLSVLASDHSYATPLPTAPRLPLNLASWDSLVYSYASEVPLVVPGFPEWSHLLWQVNRYEEFGPSAAPLMPPPRPDSSNLLTPEEVRLLWDWIAQGAPNAAGNEPFGYMKATTHRKVFVCNSGSDLVAVLHADTYHLMAFIRVGVLPNVIESPHYVRLSPDGRFLYVTLINGSAIEKYRTDTYEKVGRLVVGSDPAHIELSSDGKRAIITHFTDGAPIKLTLIDAERLEILDELRDPSGLVIARPHGLWITPDFRYAYVTANAENYITKVEISPDRQSFVDFVQIPLAPGEAPQVTSQWGPYQIVSPPESPYYFVSCDARGEVRAFSKQNDSFLTALPVAAAPKLMAYHQKLLYVACLKAAAPALQGQKLGAIAVIDAENLRVLTHVYNTGHLPRGIGVDPVSNRLWLSFENTGEADPPHHYVGGLATAPAKAYILQVPTFNILAIREMALVGYGLEIAP